MKQHEAILGGLRKHDSKAASEAMSEHLDLIYEYIIKEVNLSMKVRLAF